MLFCFMKMQCRIPNLFVIPAFVERSVMLQLTSRTPDSFGILAFGLRKTGGTLEATVEVLNSPGLNCPEQHSPCASATPGSEAMCVGRRLRPLIRTNSTAAGPRALRSRQKRSKMTNFCLLLPPNPARTPFEVDKNGSKCLNFVYRIHQTRPARPSK